MIYKLRYKIKEKKIKDGIYTNFEDLTSVIFKENDFKILKKMQRTTLSTYDDWFNSMAAMLKFSLEESSKDGYKDFGDFRIDIIEE
jgi:hypothetical protein